MRRKIFKDLPIRSKLMMLLTSASTTAVVMAFLALTAVDLASTRRNLSRDLGTLASVIGLNSMAALTFSDSDAAREALEALRVKPSVTSAAIFDAEGRPFASYRTSANDPIPTRLQIRHPRSSFDIAAQRLSVARPIEFDGKTIGAVWVTTDLRDAWTRARGFIQAGFLIVCLSAVIALLVSSKLEQRVSAPIIALAQLARDVHQTRDYSKRASARIRNIPGDEVGSLIRRFDDMLAEIQVRDDALEKTKGDLEDQVRLRTAALRHSNEELADAKTVAERRAEENEVLSNHMQRILDGAADGIFGVDQDGVATFVNSSAARMLGWEVDDLVGRRIHDLIHPVSEHALSLRECLVCSGSVEPRVRIGKSGEFRQRSGRHVPVEYTASTLEGELEESRGVVVTFRDVTERTKIERLKDEFVSTVSHELRTPLTSIRGALGLLAGGKLGQFEPRVNRMFDIALTNTERLIRLINDILDVERIQSGKIQLERRMVDSCDLIDEALAVVQAIADRAGIALVSRPHRAGLYLDPDRTIQTLTNLLGNAIKFSPPGSEVVLSCTADDEAFTFTVRDRGRGIPPGKLDTIFERFQQVDASDSRDKGGTGLGLAICRSLVEAHGGRIWAESAEGEGSTFRFTIPLPARLGASGTAVGSPPRSPRATETGLHTEVA